MPYFVYILLCSDKSYYIGSTNNLEKRFKGHQAGTGGAYTRSHKPTKILYTEKFPDKSSALRREARLKRLSRPQKEALIGDNINQE